MSLLTPELLRRLEQFQLLAARRTCPSPSAKRMNVNSRGCQPTESHQKKNTTLKGSHIQPSNCRFRVHQFHKQSRTVLFGPFRADVLWLRVPWVSPTAIRVVRLQRTAAPNFLGNCFAETNHTSRNHPQP